MGKLVLYEHNKEAYEKVKIHLEKYGKTGVIHPTGTGKSYIAFALIEDNPDKQFLWLSSSEYIYKLQTDNLIKEQNIIFHNVIFHTYAWLTKNIDNIADIDPDYIILDEFHRAGAPKWRHGIDHVISKFPQAKILGLTATNIRYLDNRRDMAHELFDNRIASYMSLPEAMSKRILPTPTYVISAYSYEGKLEHYMKKVDSIRNSDKKPESNELIKELKRHLDNALGVEQILAKHIKKKAGKYLVFCRDALHMYDMMTLVTLWFTYIDRRPHVYSVYSNNSESKREFVKFLNDDSSHLKLLFSIDMLNEGIHIHDVDGVILLRTTKSPIVYRQQIGRALSAGSKNTPIIFDMVNNIDSLYNVNLLKNEYDTLYSMHDIERKDRCNSGKFEIIDELRDCRKLFERLNKNISSTEDEPKPYTKLQMKEYKHVTFDSFLKEYIRYKDNNGSKRMPANYKSRNGMKLGQWTCKMRQLYQQGNLSEYRIERLKDAGFDWEIIPRSWERQYNKAKDYYEKNGNLDISKEYIIEYGSDLNAWLKMQRVECRKTNRGRLSKRQKELLKTIGIQ